MCLISLREIFNAGLERNSEGTLALRLFQVCRCLRLKNAYILYVESNVVKMLEDLAWLVPLKAHLFHGAGTSGVSTPVRSGAKVS